MTAMPESFNFTKGVHRHVYLALLERVERYAPHSEAGSKDNTKGGSTRP